MGKKDKSRRTPTSWKRSLHMVKTVLKASTHVFTVAGVIVAASPVLPGLKLASTGDFTAAANQLQLSTIGGVSSSGSAETVTQGIKSAVVNVGIPIAVGIGLVFAGGQLRKRIGN